MQAVETSERTAVEIEKRQFVTFTLGSDLYGIDVMKAQEVMGITAISHVPDTLPFMKGVIDLRGRIVPVVDLRIKFGLDEKAYDEQTIIIITEVHGELVGLVVDSVVDVLLLSVDEVQNTSHFTSRMDRDSVQGIAKYDENIIIMLEVDRILSTEEMKGMVR